VQHCDPHPGNVLLRNADGQLQVVLIDHGLYQTLSEEFRLDYVNFWFYGIGQDQQSAVEKFCDKYGVRHPDLFARLMKFQFVADRLELDVQTNEAGDEIVGVKTGEATKRAMHHIDSLSCDEKKRWRQLFEQMPPELRLVLRNNALARGLNQLLGANIDRLLIQGDIVESVLMQRDDIAQPSLAARAMYHIRLQIYSILAYVFSFFV
jgi:aarF domain-containing kinase